MILFTSGFPQSGKTELSFKINQKIDDVIHINPKDFYLKEFEELPDEMQSAVAISAWEMAVEKTNECLIHKSNDILIIFDTCCSNESAMRSLFTNARYNKHTILYVFVDSPQEDRWSRNPQAKLSQYERKYKTDFTQTLPVLTKLSDQFVRVTNDGKLDKLNKYAEEIAQYVEKIRSG